jgi:26S proteasome regulatory subunit N11
MLKHGRAGVPMEVMGLMLGEFVDEYTVQVIDVFAMPQSGTTVTVESVDHVFQTKMVDMLKQTGRYVRHISMQFIFAEHRFLLRPEIVVGWYHSHPGFGCWLSSVDINTQQVGFLLDNFVRTTLTRSHFSHSSRWTQDPWLLSLTPFSL